MRSFWLCLGAMVRRGNETRQEKQAAADERRRRSIFGLHRRKKVVPVRRCQDAKLDDWKTTPHIAGENRAKGERSISNSSIDRWRGIRQILDDGCCSSASRRFVGQGLIALLALGLFNLSVAQAGDGGELSVRFAVQNEAVFLHPSTVAFGAQSSAPVGYALRLGGQLAYGLTHWLELNVGGGITLPHDVTSSNVLRSRIRGNLTSSYWDVLVPIGVAIRWDRGPTLTAGLSLAAGPAFLQWRELGMQGSAKGVTFPIDANSSWGKQWFAQAGLLGQWRPLDWLALSVGPHVIRKSKGDLHLGVTCMAELIAGFGPSL